METVTNRLAKQQKASVVMLGLRLVATVQSLLRPCSYSEKVVMSSPMHVGFKCVYLTGRAAVFGRLGDPFLAKNKGPLVAAVLNGHHGGQ